MRVALALLISSASVAIAEDQSPFLLLGGWSYLNAEARNRTTDEGIHLSLVTFLHESAMIGIPCLDVDYRHASGNGQRLVSIGACYVERFAIEESVYGGLGVGSSWHQLRVKTDGEDVRADRYRIGGKALIGYRVVDRLVIEGQYHYSGIVEGVDTTGFTLSAGWWF